MGAQSLKYFTLYSIFFNCFFWLPIFFLYFNSVVSLKEVLLLESLYYFVVVLLEVPSGYFSDRYGRKKTLVISMAALLLSYIFFSLAPNFQMLCLGQIFLALGYSFQSGTNVSYHYDTLLALGREKEFYRLESVLQKKLFFTRSLTVLAGGIIGTFSFKWVYGVGILTSILGCYFGYKLIEPRLSSDISAEAKFLKQIGHCFKYLKKPVVLWMSLFSVALTILIHIPYQFYQPYLTLSLEKTQYQVSHAPWLSGVMNALTMLLGMLGAHFGLKSENKFSPQSVCLIGLTLVCLLIWGMALKLHLVILVLILFRSFSEGLTQTPMNSSLAPELESSHRATFLSLISLIGRLGFSGLLFLMAFKVAKDAPTSWPELKSLLVDSSYVGLGFLMLLLILAPLTASKNERK